MSSIEGRINFKSNKHTLSLGNFITNSYRNFKLEPKEINKTLQNEFNVLLRFKKNFKKKVYRNIFVEIIGNAQSQKNKLLTNF